MIQLANSGNTEVIVTLYENCSNITDPYFTWRLVRKGSFDEYIFTQEDHSPTPYYYSAFTFSISQTFGATSAQLNIPAGEYIYDVFEMVQQNNLIIGSAIGLVETSILILGATFTTINTYTQSDTDQIKFYQN